MGKLNDSIESLAESLSDRIYLDVAKWHLYLKDAKLDLLLAERFYALIEENRVNLAAVQSVLQDVKVSIGRGRSEIPLLQFLPLGADQEAFNILQDFQAKY